MAKTFSEYLHNSIHREGGHKSLLDRIDLECEVLRIHRQHTVHRISMEQEKVIRSKA